MTEQKSSRRRFLGGAAGAAGVALALTTWRADTAAAASQSEETARELAARPPGGPTSRSPIANRSFTSGKFAIEIDGMSAGWVQSVEGGHTTSDVVTEKSGADHIAHKHIAGAKYEPITLNAGTGMSKQFYDWIKSSFDLKFTRKSGVIHAAGNDLRERSRRQFFDALITEVGMPALDAASKDAAKMTLTWAPERVRFQKGDGQKVQSTINPARQKQWRESNFRFTLGDLETKHVQKIEAFTIKPQILQNQVGSQFDVQPGLGFIEVPNLILTVPLSHADDFLKWHEDFVINGNNGRDKVKNGALEFLGLDGQTLFRLGLMHVGIFGITDDDDDASNDADASIIDRIKVELYVESMTFDFGASAFA